MSVTIFYVFSELCNYLFGKKKKTNSQGGIVVDIDNDLDYLNWSSGTNLAENNIILKE